MTDITDAWLPVVEAVGIEYVSTTGTGHLCVEGRLYISESDWQRLTAAWAKVWHHIHFTPKRSSTLAPAALRLAKRAFDDPEAVFTPAELVELTMDLESLQ